jgi:hypothetical protein
VWSLNVEALKNCRLGPDVDVACTVVEWFHTQPRVFLQRVSIWCLSERQYTVTVGTALFLAYTTMVRMFLEWPSFQ